MAGEFKEEHEHAEDEFEQNWAQYAAQRTEEAKQWRAKWPNHCKHCVGWGGSAYSENHGIPGPGETIFDPCGAIEDPTICHRCGEKGLTEDSEGPCTKCGWNFDDGEPQL